VPSAQARTRDTAAPFNLQFGVSVALDHAAATGALGAVPRLQRKHYELIPKVLDEMAFWEAFFSHATVIVAETAPALIPVSGQGAPLRAAAAKRVPSEGIHNPLTPKGHWKPKTDEHGQQTVSRQRVAIDAAVYASRAAPLSLPLQSATSITCAQKWVGRVD